MGLNVIGKTTIEARREGGGWDVVETDLIKFPFGAGEGTLDPTFKEDGLYRVVVNTTELFEHPEFGQCQISMENVVLTEDGEFCAVTLRKFDAATHAVVSISYDQRRSSQFYAEESHKVQLRPSRPEVDLLYDLSRWVEKWQDYYADEEEFQE